jgi:HK97 gp10 family phage protein
MGLEVLFDRLPPMSAALEPRLARLVQQGAADIAAKAIELIESSPGGGRIYHGHVASAPGEPPRSDTGELVGSITATGSGLSAEVRVDSGHAVYLEYGTSKMAPRPFLQPAIDAETPKLAGVLPQVVELA